MVFDNDLHKKHHLKMFDISGKIVLKIHNITGNQVQINGIGFEPGYYIIELSGGQTYREKIIIQ
ncbi:MAG: T9SS type A sorting domain-containing protein [bacterium]